MQRLLPDHTTMAEGGGEEELSNPFSFKSYVKKKTKPQGEEDIDTDDIFAITGATGSRKKEKQSLVVAEDDDDASQSTKSKKKGNKENPFSFKKFLGQSGQQRRNPPPDVSSNGAPPVGISAASSSHQTSSSPGQGLGLGQHATVPPDFASDLPDFIQNHFHEEPARQGQDRRQLPDFTLQTSSQDSNRQGSGEERSGSGQADNAFSDEEEDGEQRGRQLSLPDFLVDSAVPAGQTGADYDSEHVTVNARTQGGSSRSRLPELPPLNGAVDDGRVPVGGDAAASSADTAGISQLREENQRLRATVAQMKHRASEEEIRVAGLEKEIARLRKKEAEETAVMEGAVQQVEENLVATTRRAVQAETVASKLRQEVKTLQGQVKMLTADNLALQSGDRGLADIRERTKYASEQLATAALTAEANLKGLLDGVEKLKLLGQVLSSLEKVSEPEASSPAEDTSPS